MASLTQAPFITGPSTVRQAFERLSATSAGLTTIEGQRRLTVYGRNELARRGRLNLALEIAGLLANPLVVLLLIASGVAFLVGERLDAGIIVTMVLLGVALNFVQTYRSGKAAERLRQSVTPQASVLRDKAWGDLARPLLVPGDIIRLKAGDLVPADAFLIEAQDLHVQEAALTGESLPVAKEVSPLDQSIALADVGPHVVYVGSSVVSGSAMALVFATGDATTFGELAEHLAARQPDTEFERGQRRFGFLIMRTATFLVFFVFAVSIALHRDPLESMLFAVALAVGLTPEFLPMITAVTLSQGAVQMARRKVVVKHLSAIQNLGSMDVLCSDKTGTLTAGAIAVDRCVDVAGAPSARVQQMVYWNSYHESGIRSPLDAAILQLPKAEGPQYAKLDEMPFDFERKCLSVVVEGEGQRLLITKGAPETVLPKCAHWALPDGGDRLLDAGTLAQAHETDRALSTAGFRVLAVAWRVVPVQPDYTLADEDGLTLGGFVAFADPVSPGTDAVLAALKADGVVVKIVSGDNELVVAEVCRQVGLVNGGVVVGADLDHMTDVALSQVAERVTAFARVTPAQKTRIILALQRRGHVVGFIGDGINDAPSLHMADVGISVQAAVDVARDAADIILLESGLAVLHDGIVAGRRAFGNVMKYLLMGTSSNFGNMFSMAVASVALPFLPMLPTQILLNNFLYDLAQITIPTDDVDASYTRKPRHWDIGLVRDFMVFVGPVSSVFDFLTFGVLLWGFQANETLFHTGWFVESLATQTLVVFVIRTAGSPLKSRPSRPLAMTVLAVIALAMVLPFTPFASALGFTPLPPLFFVFLAVVVGSYLALVEVVKRRLMGRLEPAA